MRVVLLRTGNIATNWFDSVPVCNLPSASLYKPVGTQIKTMAEGKHQFPTMEPDEYARRVVRDVLAAKHSTIVWRGAQASLVKWAVVWVPLWILVSFVSVLLCIGTDFAGKTSSEGFWAGCFIVVRCMQV